MAAAKRVAIALGTNLGDRLGNILAALAALRQLDIRVAQLSRLYESAPAYVTDQPAFLNAAALVETVLDPLPLLQQLKQVEAQLGRDFGGPRFGPRPIDLDIIFYEGQELRDGDRLIIPHPRWAERGFVKAPLADLAGAAAAGGSSGDGALTAQLRHAAEQWSSVDGGETALGTPDLQCVMPMGRFGLWPWQQRTSVMGILNVTPDSFSDGGRHNSSVEAAVAHASHMVADGADILDVGGQSTRPGSAPLPPEEEAARVVPVIRALAAADATRSVPLSIDTFYADVAAAAVDAGATMVNDVSGGTMDPGMFGRVAQLGVPYVLMHMRGTPATMQQRQHTRYEDVTLEVAAALQEAGQRAMATGVEPWRLVLDPGLGFAKTREGNLQLIAQLRRLRAALAPPLAGVPLLLGPSRKGFLGKLTGREVAADRDAATVAAAALCVAEGANIIRAHNVAAVRDAVQVADAVARVRTRK